VPKVDGFVKSQKTPFPVIPAEAGIQFFQLVTAFLDPGFRRGDDFLRVHQILILEILNVFLHAP